jgi:hypothetical protein
VVNTEAEDIACISSLLSQAGELTIWITGVPGDHANLGYLSKNIIKVGRSAISTELVERITIVSRGEVQWVARESIPSRGW